MPLTVTLSLGFFFCRICREAVRSYATAMAE